MKQVQLNSVRILSLVLLLQLFSFNSFSQNCDIECTELLQNTKLEIDPPGGWPLSNNTIPLNAFYHGLIPNWWATHGSPSIIQEDGNGFYNYYFTNSNGTEKNSLAIMDGVNGNRGGIFQNITLINDPFISYDLYLKCRNFYVFYLDNDGQPNHLIRVLLASNLVNHLDPSNTPHIPPVVPNKLLGSLHMNVFNESLEINIPFSLGANENFNQIWLYTDQYMNEVTTEEITTIETVNLTCKTTALNDIIATGSNKTYSFEAKNISDFDFVEFCWDFGDGTSSALSI